MKRLFLKIFFVIIFLSFFSNYSTAHAASSTELLTKPWTLTASNGASEQYQLIDPNALKGNTNLRITYNLKGTCLLDGDASAIIFDQPINRTWRYISLSKYGKNCNANEQTVDIPLSHFNNLDPSLQVGTFHVRIWNDKPYSIDITSASLYSNAPTPTPTPTPSPSNVSTPTPTTRPTSSPTPTPPPTPTPTPKPIITTSTSQKASWSIQSVSSMKETKDRICGQRSTEFIQKWVDKAVEVGANYVAIETPYDSPSCGNSVLYTKTWVNLIRSRGLKIWHRHMPLAFEGIYDTPKNPSIDYLTIISNYIKANPSFFQQGDIFTPIPEPQNGGIAGVNYCPYGICIFKNAKDFNAWLRNAMDVSESAFAQIGLGGKIKIGYYGFDGYIAWGDNNPDWDGILEDQTVLKMGNITIDHYPEIVGDTMQNDLNELESRYPNIPIIIGEWGTITSNNTENQVIQSMGAARRPSVVGFNYWHFGMGGHEELIREDFTNKPQFDEVQSYFKRLR
ncbi:MAG: hypothetical protein A3D74_02560 [Candidatus Levybacteria bacterium RIFCSPHIGHO2_02_FULL_37_13]|nr:MAG: hypothetical protein A3D74_02560 [Candidatus Levybacteria bacterium RIFCSPHIGHO2_02_FULL_37_13]